jgi:hypothetical protein
VQDNYAILVGVSHYADPASFPPLDGPVRDVALMREWLITPTGGDVPEDHVTTIVSDGAPPPPDGDMPPVFQNFLDAFMRVVKAPDRSYVRRPNGRLYLYFSGHGFSQKVENMPQAALYTANSDQDVTWNIFGTFFARWTKDQDLFGEIVLIMDCCRDAELTRTPMRPPLRQPTGLGTVPRLVEVYAAPRGGKAQERPIPSRNNEVHGLLTHAFLLAIDHAAPSDARVSTAALKDFLAQQWDNVCDGKPADPPEVVVPTNGEILFNRTSALPIDQRFVLTALSAGGTADIYGKGFTRVAHLTVGANDVTVDIGGTQSHVVIGGDRAIVVPLPAGLYGVNTSANAAVQNFQAGGPDVTL